jgi:mannose-6-phosphate isomerase-like protein (cupin superfamily)
VLFRSRGELTYGKDTYTLGTGDSIAFASDIPHVLRNTGKRPLKAIWIITPPKMHYFGAQPGGNDGKDHRGKNF